MIAIELFSMENKKLLPPTLALLLSTLLALPGCST